LRRSDLHSAVGVQTRPRGRCIDYALVITTTGRLGI